MEKRDIIVIGASAGGIIALLELLKCIPGDFEGYVFIVQHLSPSPSILPQILSRSGKMEAVHPKDGQFMKKNTIYIAPPDHHMLLEMDRIIIKKGPKENRFRPSIDALFRSAAYTYGSRVIGIVLTGLLDDGTSGLWTVKRLNGICIVQDPAEADFPSMPLSVLEYVDADFVVPLCEMGALLMRLTTEPAPEKGELGEEERDLLEAEINIAAQLTTFEKNLFHKGRATVLSCPECSGALIQFNEEKIIRFRCHAGHAFTHGALLTGVANSVEENMWKSVRGLEEITLILEGRARQYELLGKEDLARLFYTQAKEMHDRAEVIRENIVEQEQWSGHIRSTAHEAKKALP